MPRPIPATAGRLALRLAACQAIGIVAGIATGSALSSIWAPAASPLLGSWIADFFMMIAFGLVFSLPFFAIALLILYACSRSILSRPLLWGMGVPAILLTLALLVFPPQIWGGIFWIALIPICAIVSGASFALWLRLRPLSFVPILAAGRTV